MDGDSPDLQKMVELCKKHQAYLIVDEAHALGVLGGGGLGIVQDLQLEKDVFIRILTFGKGLGCHGAVVLGSYQLQQYLINFSRSFIYTTGLPPHSIATIKMAYQYLVSKKGINRREKLKENIAHFSTEVKRNNLSFLPSDSAIQCCVISGNDKVKNIAKQLKEEGFYVKPILSPTVPKGKERLRFCLHSTNTLLEITQVLNRLSTFVV
jgi:8-amino-7-oxononanoate synthase